MTLLCEVTWLLVMATIGVIGFLSGKALSEWVLLGRLSHDTKTQLQITVALFTILLLICLCAGAIREMLGWA